MYGTGETQVSNAIQITQLLRGPACICYSIVGERGEGFVALGHGEICDLERKARIKKYVFVFLCRRRGRNGSSCGQEGRKGFLFFVVFGVFILRASAWRGLNFIGLEWLDFT